MDIAKIQKRIELLEKYEEEVRAAKEMLQGELENSLEYLEAVEEAKELTKKKKLLKEEIINAGPNQKLAADIKSNGEEIKTLKEILSVELMQVYKESDSDLITDRNGESRKFKVVVRLLPKKGIFQGRDNFGKYESDKE